MTLTGKFTSLLCLLHPKIHILGALDVKKNLLESLQPPEYVLCRGYLPRFIPLFPLSLFAFISYAAFG
jgi:hypothetical protein